jgi:hypothetical protein
MQSSEVDVDGERRGIGGLLKKYDVPLYGLIVNKS